jgi:hypothetical protein
VWLVLKDNGKLLEVEKPDSKVDVVGGLEVDIYQLTEQGLG